MPKDLETKNRAQRSRHGAGAIPQREPCLALLAILLLVIVSMANVVSFSYPKEENQRFSSLTTSSTSWNPNVACSPSIVTMPDILGSSYPSQSLTGSPWQTSSSSGGIPNKRALSPPCTLTDMNGQTVSAFVQINNVSLSNYFYETRDCSNSFNPVNYGGASYPGGQTMCDSTGDLQDVGASSGAYIHGEIDQDWMVQGWVGPRTTYDNNSVAQVSHPCTISVNCSGSVPIDVQGFVYWDPEGQWELHPLTAWKIAGLSVRFSADPTNPTVGQTVTFTGTAVGGSVPYSFEWSFGDGVTATGATTTHSFSSRGIYTVRLNVTDSTGKNSTVSQTLPIDIPDFTIVASPSILVIQPGTSASSTLTVTSVNGFYGTLIIGASAFPSGPDPSVSPMSITLAAGATVSSILTVSLPLGTLSPDYSVTITATGGATVHSTAISVFQSSSGNRPPVVTVPGQRIARTGNFLSFAVTTFDPDPGESLTLSASGLPTGANFDPATGNFSWRPSSSQAGTFRITFTATDDGTPPLSNSEVVQIQVEGTGWCILCQIPFTLANSIWLLAVGGMGGMIASLTAWNLRAHSRLRRAREHLARVGEP